MRTETINELAWGRIRDAQRVVPASRSTYYNWIKSGLVHSRRIQGARYIDMDWLRRSFENAPAKAPAKVQREMKKRALASAKARAAKNGVSDASARE